MLLVCCSNVESSPPFARSYMKKNPVALIRSYGKKIQFLLIACKNQFWLSRTLSRPYKTFRPNNDNTAAILGHLTSVLILSMRTKTRVSPGAAPLTKKPEDSGYEIEESLERAYSA